MATYKVKIEGVEYKAVVVDKATGGSVVTIDDRKFEVEFLGDESRSGASPLAVSGAEGAAAEGGTIVAPIPGKIVSILVKPGDTVSANEVVMKLEAMKMENDISSPISGTVEEIAVNVGSETGAGDLLMTVA
jgi:biotin carboxyl carrier protein